ncbi:hypothetical protein FKM82_020204 [Ascaphus truei]
MKSLSWLPIKSRISHSILLLTFKALHSSALPYISALISRYEPSRLLRSSQVSLLSTPFVSKALSRLNLFHCLLPLNSLNVLYSLACSIFSTPIFSLTLYNLASALLTPRKQLSLK